MRISRRAFLGSVAGSLLGCASTGRAGLKDLQDRQIEKSLARFGGPVTGNGFLDQPAFVIDDDFRPPQVPYEPQPGDILFSISKFLVYRAGHWLSGAGDPNHSAIVFRRPDGSLATLEAGPFDVAIVCTLDLLPHLSAYHGRGRAWVRTRVTPLTEEQSCRLTEAAMAQEDKRFARFRLYSQVTPFRVRGPLRTNFIGQSHGIDRPSYFCSELVTECLIYAGLMDAANTRPPATFPHELFYDQSINPFLNRHYKLAPCWNPPARWRPHPCNGCDSDSR